MGAVRTTGAQIKVLNALLDQHGSPVYGLELLRSTHLKSGTVYPLLDRLDGRARRRRSRGAPQSESGKSEKKGERAAPARRVCGGGSASAAQGVDQPFERQVRNGSEHERDCPQSFYAIRGPGRRPGNLPLFVRVARRRFDPGCRNPSVLRISGYESCQLVVVGCRLSVVSFGVHAP